MFSKLNNTRLILLLFILIIFNNHFNKQKDIEHHTMTIDIPAPQNRIMRTFNHWVIKFKPFNHIADTGGHIYGLPTNAKDMIKLHEGTRKRGGLHIMYRDTSELCVGGCLTIGYGHLIGPSLTNKKKNQIGRIIGRQHWNGEGLNDSEANRLFDHDYTIHAQSLYAALPWVKNLNTARQAVLIDMNFNLGTAKLLKFKRTLDLIQGGQYEMAANNLKHTPYYRQVGSRSKRLCRILITGRISLR